jgi:hypothetical protein
MQHSDSVQLGSAEQHLLGDALDLLQRERVAVDVLAEVLVTLLEDQVDLIVLGDDLEEFGDVGVVEVVEQGYFSEGGDWDSFFSAFGSDLFQCHCCVRFTVDCFVYNSLGSFSEFI